MGLRWFSHSASLGIPVSRSYVTVTLTIVQTCLNFCLDYCGSLIFSDLIHTCNATEVTFQKCRHDFFLNQVSIANKLKFPFLSATFKDLHDLGPKITSHITPMGPTLTHNHLWIYLWTLF